MENPKTALEICVSGSYYPESGHFNEDEFIKKLQQLVEEALGKDEVYLPILYLPIQGQDTKWFEGFYDTRNKLRAEIRESLKERGLLPK